MSGRDERVRVVEQTSTTRKRANWLERVRHVAWSGLIALVLLIPTVLDPIDQVAWVTQSRLASQPASGDIVFVGTDADMADATAPQARQALADLVGRLDQAGVSDVYIDLVFDRPSTAEADADLNTALRDFSGSAYLVRNEETGLNGDPVISQNSPSVNAGVAEVASTSWINYLGYTWYLPYAVEAEGEVLPNLPAQLAGIAGEPDEVFSVSYQFELASIPAYRTAELASGSDALEGLAGKTVVIGTSDP